MLRAMAKIMGTGSPARGACPHILLIDVLNIPKVKFIEILQRLFLLLGQRRLDELHLGRFVERSANPGGLWRVVNRLACQECVLIATT